ncbi:MAG: hypothetical protein IIC83_02985 [Chloroflexi bacterium]|nr:hypothetical protein [Chloroflexota bacterium]
MRITDVRAVYPNYRHVVPSWRTHFWQIVVRVETDAGVVGLGYGGGGVASVEIVNRHFRELMVGKKVDSVADIEGVWDMLYDASLPYGRKGLAIMALSGIDLALYDLLGKAEAVPVYALFGGLKKQKAFAYATGQSSELYREKGFMATKFAHRWTGDEADYDDAVDRARRARDLYGADAMIMVDCYMSWDGDVTLEMSRRLAEFNLFWFEDVLNPDDLVGQAALRDKVKPTLIAGGEHEFSHHGFRDIAEAGALGLWQPDLTWCGGITAGLRILDIARRHDIPVSPHRGGEVWGLHLIVGSDCMDLAEVHNDQIVAERDELWLNAPTAVDGYIAPTDAPGFGVALNEAML